MPVTYYKSPECGGKVRYARIKGSIDVKDIFGGTIVAGTPYYIFVYKRGENDYIKLGNKGLKDTSRCELCGIPVWHMSKVIGAVPIRYSSSRFCCVEHGENHFQRANMEFEEYMWDRGLYPGGISV